MHPLSQLIVSIFKRPHFGGITLDRFYRQSRGGVLMAGEKTPHKIRRRDLDSKNEEDRQRRI
ncbi:MAG: hypothetical protein R6V67_09965 [Spirochaetia bacterium]